jgi:predicted transcriptional regulator
MGHTLTLEIPEDVFESLEKIAKQTGRTPEEIILHSIATHARQAADDPLDKWIGAFDSGIPDWADNHDKYIGESILQHMHNEND